MIRPKPFIMALVPLSLTGCGTVDSAGEGAARRSADEAEPASASIEAADACSLLVRFGSYAMGIDAAAAAAVDRLVRQERDVLEAHRSHGGREGEYALCVRTRTSAGAVRLFGAIKAALPAEPRGPIELVSGASRYAVPRR